MCFGGFKLLPLNSIFLRTNFKARFTPCPDKKINILAFKIAKYELQTNATTDYRTIHKIAIKKLRLTNILIHRGRNNDITGTLNINESVLDSSSVLKALINHYKDKIQQQQAAAVNLEEQTLEEQPVERHSPTPDADETQSISQSNAGASASGSQSAHLQQNEFEHQTNQEILNSFEGLILQIVDNVNHAHEDKEKNKESSKNILMNLNILYQSIRTRFSSDTVESLETIRNINLLTRYFYHLLLITYSFSTEELPDNLIFPKVDLSHHELNKAQDSLNDIFVKYKRPIICTNSEENINLLKNLKFKPTHYKNFNTFTKGNLGQHNTTESKLRFSDETPQATESKQDPNTPKSEDDQINELFWFSDETSQATESKQEPSASKSEEEQINELFEFLNEKEGVVNEKDETTIL